MTTYTAITNGQIDQDSPITQPLLTAMRDNPIAITEGATGAPRIVGLAAATIDLMPLLTVSAADTYSLGFAMDFTAGNSSASSIFYVTAATIDIVRATGSARFTAQHYIDATDSTTSGLRLMKNGTQVALWTTTSPQPVLRSIDVAIAVGDQFIWEHRTTTNFSDRISIAIAYEPTATEGYAGAPLLIKASET